MRVIVCGSRDIESASDALRIWDALDAMEPRPTIIVHGDCRGADSIAKSWAVMRPPLGMKSGTADMVRKAQRAGIRVVEVRL